MLFEFLDKELGLELDIFQRTITVLGNFYISISLGIFSHVIGGDIIIIRSIQEHDHVSILFNGSRFTEIRKLRNLLAVFSFFNLTTQLTECNDRNLQLFGQLLEVP